MARAVISMGSNLGDRAESLKKAAAALDRLPKCRVVRTSSFYETEPIGVSDEQPDYINCVAEIETELSPHALLGACLGIEVALGRERIYDKCPRVIDLDVILYEGYTELGEELTVPHYAMRERAFVLLPLSELYPDLSVYGNDYLEDLEKLGDQRLRKADI